jgi:LmbE family N-acetylglucosaminyl deacetylase
LLFLTDEFFFVMNMFFKPRQFFLLRVLVCCFALTTVEPLQLSAQKQPTLSSSEILQQIKRLNVLGSVLYVAAHPDDENTRFLAYMARDRQYRTGYLAMTRGDGGQNLIGDEQGIELGLIRTQELLGARRNDGAEQFFTRAFDFGFSKSTEEALAMWDKDKTIADAVWVIRKFRPDIIVTRFPEDARAGHGHHSASAVVAREAFIAAADPKKYPEQFKFGVGPWQVRRILWNTYSFGSANTTSDDQLKIDMGSYLPLLGKSIGEIAAEGRSQHRSQGFGSASTRGTSLEYFVHTLGERAEKDLFDGIETSWSRLEGGSHVADLVLQLISSFNVSDPAASISQLIAVRKALAALNDPYWRQLKTIEVDQIIRYCAGLHMEALAPAQFVEQGDTLKINVSINNRSGEPMEVLSIIGNSSFTDSATTLRGTTNKTADLTRSIAQEISKSQALKTNSNWMRTLSIPVASFHPVSQPYWLVKPMNTGSFNVDNQEIIGMAENRPAFSVQFHLRIQDETIQYTVPVVYRVVDPAKGEFFHPLYVIPRMRMDAPPQPMLINTSRDADLQKKKAAALAGGPASAPVMHVIKYEHIPTAMYFSRGERMQIQVNLKTAGKRIGYIVGAGDKVPEMIRLMGYEVVELGRDDIQAAQLAGFDAVVLGVRAYNVHDWLNQKYEILMDYVRNGGNMVVQYNTNSNAGPFKNRIGPKPFTISRGRVTEEDAQVVFLDGKHSLLSYPNKITAADFSGWIQERGIYFADAFGAGYTAPLAMHDKGEQDLNGGLIVAAEGKGRFIYTGLAFFRQLPAGVPGAFRLFANLISNPNSKLND